MKVSFWSFSPIGLLLNQRDTLRKILMLINRRNVFKLRPLSCGCLAFVSISFAVSELWDVFFFSHCSVCIVPLILFASVQRCSAHWTKYFAAAIQRRGRRPHCICAVGVAPVLTGNTRWMIPENKQVIYAKYWTAAGSCTWWTLVFLIIIIIIIIIIIAFIT